jgi:hypothetical protein
MHIIELEEELVGDEVDDSIPYSHRLLRRPRLGECEVDCNRTKPCAKGLLCAKQHRRRLIRNGWPLRKAYCNTDVGDTKHVCFNPLKLKNKICRSITMGSCNIIIDKPCQSEPYCCRFMFLNGTCPAIQTCIAPISCHCAEESVGSLNGTWSCFMITPLPCC